MPLIPYTSFPSPTEVLRAHPFFSGLADGELGPILETAQAFEVPRKERLIEAGDTGQRVWIVTSGLFVIARPGRSSGSGHFDELFAYRGPGALLGPLCAITRIPHSYSTIALTHSKVLRIDGASFRSIVIESKTLLARLVRHAHVMLEEDTRHRQRFAHLNAVGRVAVVLLELASATKNLDLQALFAARPEASEIDAVTRLDALAPIQLTDEVTIEAVVKHAGINVRTERENRDQFGTAVAWKGPIVVKSPSELLQLITDPRNRRSSKAPSSPPRRPRRSPTR